MAILSGLHLWVRDEEYDSPVEVSSHPVETGVNITDHVKAGPMTLSITGEIVGPGYLDKVNQIKNWQRTGMVVQYIGVNVFSSAQIISFSYGFSNKIDGGCEFSMGLQEIAVAQNVFWTQKAGYDGDMLVSVKGNDGTVQVVNLSEQKQRFHMLMAGETLWFIASQYRACGVTVDGLRELNRDRDVFQPGRQGDFEAIRTGAELLLGSW